MISNCAEPTTTATPARPTADPASTTSTVADGAVWRSALGAFVLAFLVVGIGLIVAMTSADGADGISPAASDDAFSVDRQAWVQQNRAEQVEDVETFLTAWSRSLSEDYAITGTLTRIPVATMASLYGGELSAGDEVDDVQPVVLTYRHARTATRELLQIGDSSVLVDAIDGERSCVTRTEGIWCTAPDRGEWLDSADGGAGNDLSGRRAGELAAVRQLVSSSSAGYRIHRVDPGEVGGRYDGDVVWPWPSPGDHADCWEARSLSGDRGHRWGRRTEFCFDRSTGAPGFRRVYGPSRVETFVAQTISPVVTNRDLEPR